MSAHMTRLSILPSVYSLQKEDLAARVACWLAARDEADDLLARWQGLETELIREHGFITSREAARRGIPLGREMRLLDMEYRTMSRTLEREARALNAQQAETLADAIAKIELGLRIMDLDPDDEASEAIREGCQALRNFLGEGPAPMGILVSGVDGRTRRPKL